MYEERRESFSVRDLILQVLFVLLFIFILIWLFPTKNYMKNYIDKNGSTNESNYELDRLSVLYNQIFADNVEKMKDSAVGYFTTPRLPSKIGESKKLTLAEMYDLHLLLKLSDKDGKYCDTKKSYVEITKYEDEYRLKVNLSCGDEEDYIIVYLGCYNYCEDGVCEKQVSTNPKKLCEYKKSDSGYWGPYTNWSEWSTTEVTANNSIDVQTEVKKVQTGTAKKVVQTGTKVEKYVSGTTQEKYVVTYVTQKVSNGMQKVQVGTTKQTVTERVVAGTTAIYSTSGSGTTVPSNTSQYEYRKTGSTTTQACSSCATVTTYTWDVYQIVNVYKTVSTTKDVPVYEMQETFETKSVPVYGVRTVNVYSTKSTPIYSEVEVPVYSNITYYRYRTRVYIGGMVKSKWDTCDNQELLNQGYYFTGNVKEA